MQTYLKPLHLQNACQIHFVECVSKSKHIISVIHYAICRAVCFQFTHFHCDDWENIYTLFYYHHQIGSMKYMYYPMFRVRSQNNGICFMSSYILIGLLFIEGVSTTHSEDSTHSTCMLCLKVLSLRATQAYFTAARNGAAVVGGLFMSRLWTSVPKGILWGSCLDF